MVTIFVMLAVTMSGDNVVDYNPVHEKLYQTQALCEADKPHQLKLHPELKRPDVQLVCGEVERDSDY